MAISRRPSAPAGAGQNVAAHDYLLVAVLVACVSADIFRLGFFADDFHFLDVARRVPLGALLLGQHGLAPWYRPLSRELYFELIVAAGPAGLALAHLLSAGCLLGAAWTLLAFGRRRGGERAAPIAPVLFVTYAFAKFLAAWPSGFQDLLATLLVLLALLDHARGRTGRSLVWAGLAPFAKETGFIAFPLIFAYVFFCERGRGRSWILPNVLVMVLAATLHLLVRTTWGAAGTAQVIERSPREIVSALAQALGGFVTIPADARGWPLAIVAGIAAALMLRAPPARDSNASRDPKAARHSKPEHGSRLIRADSAAGSGAFLLAAAALGFAPMLVGAALGLTRAHPYYAFPAAPWVALGAAWLAARPLGSALRFLVPALRFLVPALAALDVCALAWRPANLDVASGWTFRRWDWPEAIRLSEGSRRLSADLRRLCPAPPESLIGLFGQCPVGILFQTEDGPALRESLHRPDARAFYLNEVPLLVPPGRLEIAVFGDERFHLEREPRDLATCVDRAATALMCGNGPTAWAWASWPRADEARFELAYARAAAVLLARGPPAYRRQLARAGLADSASLAPEQMSARLLADDPGLRAALARMLRHPLDAAAHEAYAESLAARGARVSGGAELRIALALDPGRCATRHRLATVLYKLGELAAARIELERIVSAGADAGLSASARDMLAAIGPPGSTPGP